MRSDPAPSVVTGSDADVAVAAALAGARVVRDAFGGPVTRHGKRGGDFATDADLASERAIREVLGAERPGDAFVGEETGAAGDAEARRRWYVDPLCGTLNFAAGTPPFCVNVALGETTAADPATGERVVAAAVADPLAADDEVLWCDETGAFRRTRPGVGATSGIGRSPGRRWRPC
jgi:myo-inositol-1(or 4)-monophosphatase